MWEGDLVFGKVWTALNPRRRLMELALPWAKFRNPYRVELVPRGHARPFVPSRGGRGGNRLTSPIALWAFPSPSMEREHLFDRPLAGLCRDRPGRAAGVSRSVLIQNGTGVGRAMGPGRDAALWAVRHLSARDPESLGSPGKKTLRNPECGSGVGKSRNGRTPWRQTPAVGARLDGGR